MGARYRGRFQLVRQFGVLLWQGTVTNHGREWWIRIPYPLSGAVADDVGYPRVEVMNLPPSPHRIGKWICLFDPDERESRWFPEHGVARLVELACLWLDAYETWLRLPPPAGGFPAGLYGLKLAGKRIPDELFPSWPAKEAPHGRRVGGLGAA